MAAGFRSAPGLPRTVVIDASVAAKWYLAEEGSEEAERLAREHTLIAPDLLLAETANVLWASVRRGRVAAGDAARAVAHLPAWFEELAAAEELLDRAFTLALRLDHPVYDCLYLAPAERRGTVLMTADRRLIDRLAGDPMEWCVAMLSA